MTCRQLIFPVDYSEEVKPSILYKIAPKIKVTSRLLSWKTRGVMATSMENHRGSFGLGRR